MMMFLNSAISNLSVMTQNMSMRVVLLFYRFFLSSGPNVLYSISDRTVKTDAKR